MLAFKHTLAVAALFGAVALGAWLAQPADACLHPESEFKYPIKAGAQRGLIYFDDGYQHMIVRPGYMVEGEGLKVKNDAVEGFTSLAWVIPLPSLPDRYEEADEDIFGELEKFTKAESTEDSNSDSRRDAKLGKADWGAEFLEPVKVGSYTIQPVKAHGELGGLELNGWLKDNKFGAIDESVLAYYIKKDWYWLAVKLENKAGLPASGNVKPLHMGFKTETPIYPLKIQQGRGALDLELWVISRNEIDTKASFAFGLRTIEQSEPNKEQLNRTTTLNKLPAKVRTALFGKDQDPAALEGEKAFVYRLFGVGLGSSVDLAKWENDLSFSFKETPAPKKEEKKAEKKADSK